jgi:uncharacterized membrane protein YccC
MPLLARAAAILRTLHWKRGVRAGFAVASAMLACRALGKPMGWAALGGFEAVLVDNGGPYRSRMNTIAAVVFGGAFCGIIGTLVPQQLLAAALVTAAVCFAVTFARVASQPIASTSVIILVIYFAGFGSSERTLHDALANVLAYVPVDPFRPARLEVAACYEILATFTARLATGPQTTHAAHDDDHSQAVEFKRQLRSKLESARAALGATPARAPSRTHRARNLSVLLETADMLFAAIVRLSELAEIAEPGQDPALPDAIAAMAQWLSGAQRAIAVALRTKPADNGASFAPEGSHRVEFVTRRAATLSAQASGAKPGQMPQAGLLQHLWADERDALQNIDIAFEALRAVWTGADAGPGRSLSTAPRPTPQHGSTLRSVPQSASGADAPEAAPEAWLEALRDNWTLDSMMLRHSLRMAAVGAADVLLMRAVHVNHGFWLAMTSIIVLQPYSTGTLRKGLERVGGTIGGGFLAALLAATIHSYTGIILVITVCSVLTLATYAVDYGWYSFFLTPTFVLMSLPYLRDWRYAGVRILTTLLGALVAFLAMRFLWPQSVTVELGGLLARCASAAAAYLRATLLFWKAKPARRNATDRELLAPARRACGLASQDAEEALDRALLDTLPHTLAFGNHAVTEAPSQTQSALTFTTYTRRFTQCLTTLAAVGTPSPSTLARIEHLIARLDAIAADLVAAESLHRTVATPSTLDQEQEIPNPGPEADPETTPYDPTGSLAEQMLQRMERQAGVLERASTAITASS